MAEEPHGAFLEVFRGATFIDETDVRARALATLVVPSTDRPLADCTQESARGYGVTGEVHSGLEYELTHEWAHALNRAGFGGIRYFVRHDPSMSLIGVALFGSAGEQNYPVEAIEPVPDLLLEEISTRFGLTALPRLS